MFHLKDMEFKKNLDKIKQGDIQFIKNIIRNNPSEINQANSKGQNYLMVACELGNTDLINALINGGAKLDMQDKNGETALHYAVKSKQVHVVVSLISKGAKPNVLNTKGNSPLHEAVDNNSIYVVNRLLHPTRGYHAKIDTQNNDGKSPLHVACRHGHTDMVRELLLCKPNIDVADRDGYTPLHVACECGHADIVKQLLQEKADVNMVESTFGYTPLHLACGRGYTDVVDALLLSQPSVTIADKDNYTPLHVACYEGQKYIAKQLMEFQHDINVVSKNGDTPLHLACFRGHKDIVKELLEFKANINEIDKDGNAPLHLAVLRHSYDVVEVLVSQDSVKLNIKNGDNMTPLLLAVSEGQLGIMHKLISKEADINAVDGGGNNCLHLAVKRNKFYSEVEPIKILDEFCSKLKMQKLSGAVVASYLAHCGANFYHKNNESATPLDYIKNPNLKEEIKKCFPRLCMLCEDKRASVIFCPCGHIVACNGICSKVPLKRCFDCRQLITSKTKIDTPKLTENGFQGLLHLSTSISLPVEQKEKDAVAMRQPFTNLWLQNDIPKLEEKDLLNVARQLGSKWWQVGIFLGIHTTQLGIIKYNNPNDVEQQSYQMLYKWFKTCDANTKIKTLRKALRDAECFDALNYLPPDEYIVYYV